MNGVDTADLRPFTCSYRYQGEEFSLTLWARSPAEAEDRLGQLTWARVDGELVASMNAAAGFWIPTWTIIVNSLRDFRRRWKL